MSFYKATFTKTQDAQPMGEYKPTSHDQVKKDADFRLMGVSPLYIRWADGRGEIVSTRQLEKYKSAHPNWVTDF
jgi:hypothetical protein